MTDVTPGECGISFERMEQAYNAEAGVNLGFRALNEGARKTNQDSLCLVVTVVYRTA